ncbi:MAG: TOBE domain-containing protein [Deferribacterales bacterium]
MKIDGKLWIDIDGLGIAGHGRIKLLELVQETGSIKKAAERIKMSYKAAWDSINSLNAVFGTPLVDRQTGGKGGGGTTLTKTGKDLIKTYNHFSRLHMMYLNTMVNSNKILGKVDSVEQTYAMITTNNGDTIACIKLDEDLMPGEEVTVFISPRDIILVDSDAFSTSARNILKTEITAVNSSGQYTEAILKTENGTELAVSITANSAQKLGLRPGTHTFALFKTASALVMR